MRHSIKAGHIVFVYVLVKPLRPRPHLIATCLLNAPTSQVTAEERQKWLAEKYPVPIHKTPNLGFSGVLPICLTANLFVGRQVWGRHVSWTTGLGQHN